MDEEAVSVLLGCQSDGRFTQVDGGGQFCDLAIVRDLQSIQRFGGVGDLLGYTEIFIEIGD